MDSTGDVLTDIMNVEDTIVRVTSSLVFLMFITLSAVTLMNMLI